MEDRDLHMSRRGADLRSVGVSLSDTRFWFSATIPDICMILHPPSPFHLNDLSLPERTLLPLVLKTLLGLFVVLTPPSHTTWPLHLASLLLLPASILIITRFFTETTTFSTALPHPCCPFRQLIYSTARTSLALIVWVTIAQCGIKHFLALNKRQQLEKVMECG